MDFDWDIFTAALTSSAFLRGALLSVTLAVCAMVLASIIGFGVALLRIASNRFATAVGGVYVWFFRAIPTLLVLLLIWNAGPQLLPALRDDWFTPFLAALIGFSIVEAAYMAEILRSALLSVDDGQHLAARALGLPPHKVLFKVVLPQAIKVAIPPSGNELIAMLKYTSLASVISLRELLTTAQSQVSVTFRYAEYYSAALVYYLVIVSALMAVQHVVERRYRWISAGRVGQVPGNQVGAAVPA
ncbi:amino acid ABC transporter permease [Mycolicibacterium sp. 120266]|jgi:His/Glu/Gln/Arg/opine family amino acid ABC transporter permease subunit|uniref:amino acid ABC transporter permease n=1 Tax=Mycolicibacterium sp. 120266 TaxID=3090601 RepID=UPI00299DB2B3|nr:amino acid ABC transporter permease [Mycolicibacterium sp. 120266]MDX1875201.1 amino acid ABC transporter permease [Mycolicibacterium sp. 120266]